MAYNQDIDTETTGDSDKSPASTAFVQQEIDDFGEAWSDIATWSGQAKNSWGTTEYGLLLPSMTTSYRSDAGAIGSSGANYFSIAHLDISDYEGGNRDAEFRFVMSVITGGTNPSARLNISMKDASSVSGGQITAGSFNETHQMNGASNLAANTMYSDMRLTDPEPTDGYYFFSATWLDTPTAGTQAAVVVRLQARQQ